MHKRLFIIGATTAALGIIAAGCGSSSESPSYETKSGNEKVLRCYDTEEDRGSTCWIRFPDDTTCLRWRGSHGETGYSSCRGGYADKLDENISKENV